MKIRFILLVLSMCIYNVSHSQLVIPENCKELSESGANGKKIKELIFDMDNDNQSDYATIVESKSEFSKFYILIYLSSLEHQYEIELFHIDDFAIFPLPLTVNKNILEFGYSEDSSAHGRYFKLRYNDKNKKIQVIGYDSSIRFPQGSCEKSYNLITGKYVVITNILNLDNKKMSERSGFVKSVELYVDNLNFKTFEILENVGKEFEPK